MRGIGELTLLLLLASLCAAQGPVRTAAALRNIQVVRSGDKIRVEITLTAPVVPDITMLPNPSRLVLDFPNTTASATRRRIVVKRNGVRQVRVALNSADPPVTRAVVDLDTAHPYVKTTAGNKFILEVLPPTSAAVVAHGRGAAPAATGLFLGKLWPRQQDKATPEKSSTLRITHLAPGAQPAGDKNLQVSFQLKYVAEGAAYISGGRASGLAKGMKLVVRDPVPPSGDPSTSQGPVVAELNIVSVADASAVAEVRNPKREVKPGDWADLSPDDSARLGQQQPSLTAAANNPVPAANPIKEPTSAPHPEMPQDESRIRMRIGFDYSGISSSGLTPGSSSSLGMALQTDMTRIAGTYWNLQGNWRGRLTTNSQPNEDTLQDYLDRTYIIQLYYDNPNSKWVAGFGRLYLPWAVSLDTIDGGYVGRKVAKGVIAGVFLGSTPDPTSWHYRPDQQITGSFVNFEGEVTTTSTTPAPPALPSAC